MIIGVDSNAHHRSWYSSFDDDRGEILIQFADTFNLEIHNRLSDFETFYSSSGSSNIDITIGTAFTVGKVSKISNRSVIIDQLHLKQYLQETLTTRIEGRLKQFRLGTR